MTEAELFDLWQRYMHRTDITADLPKVRMLVDMQIMERCMMVVDPDALLANNPRMHLHCGLKYLHELAQDDDGANREWQLFEQAALDYQLYASRQTTTPSMVRPY